MGFFTLISFGEMIVANKFLPFIVEKSLLHSIYQTMLTRSKGINTITFLNVFLIVGKHGIKTVRDFVNSRSEKMTTEDLYQSISNHFGSDVNSEDYNKFNLLRHTMTIDQLTEGDTKFNEYSISDILGFIYVAAVLGKSEEYFKTDYSSYLKNYPDVLQNLKEFINLDDENHNVEICVETKDELISNILYYAIIDPDPSHIYKFKKSTYGKKESDDGQDEEVLF